MIPIDGQPILTAAAMRAAEASAVEAGTSLATLMERAGQGVAEATRRLAAGAEVLILCGPGNNGGDGWVAAATLAAVGHPVRVAALAEPATDLARAARARWTGPVEMLAEAEPAPVVVDALFGIGLSRDLDEAVDAALHRLRMQARVAIAVDVPSGIDSDDGSLRGDPPCFDLTLALGALKPAHLLLPAAAHCGAVRLLGLCLDTESRVSALARPFLPVPSPWDHKFSRGMVTVICGTMPGASELAALAAARAGAGYVLLLDGRADAPQAIVRRPWSSVALDDKRIGAVVIGPGLGRDETARERFETAWAAPARLVIDGDALRLLDPGRRRVAPTILTPHTGEFDHLFGAQSGSKIDRTRAAAEASNMLVVHKGADTVIASPHGEVVVSGGSSVWLSTAGTGDVLAGACGAMLAAGLSPFDAAKAAVWLHGEAARRAGPAFLADDLAVTLAAVRRHL